MKTEFRAVREGKPCQLQQPASRSGLPKCIHCLRTVPRRERESSLRHELPALFCTSNCAVNFGRRIGRQIYVGVRWKEPNTTERPKMSHATSIGVGTVIKRRGRTYEIVDRRVEYIDTDVAITLDLKDAETGKTHSEKVNDHSRVQIIRYAR